MPDSAFVIFIIFGVVWIVMGAVAVIALFKSEGQKLRFDKWGLLVTIPIIVPIVIVLLYQVIRPLIF
ncbi:MULTISPECIES: hypothetical protein [Nostoc]|uniref:Uncharacterized protein n=2 Tax=Nostoc TaxID=1177 RepID=A0A0M4SXC0_9NOSO|nr:MULTISPECIES: hypothetical protein [Nostoc]ALF53596.1 hypothetical protein ACX27_13315 [Nostoc piscinale CENA21]MBD2494587.1 hypothetical protein [Nostoc sp. FACHB-280]MBD2598522.1 hypothetical protein [Nostoc spongiaeforme FACHB-130]